MHQGQSQAAGQVPLGQAVLELQQHLQEALHAAHVLAVLEEGRGLGAEHLEVLQEQLGVALALQLLEGLRQQQGQVGLVAAGLGEQVGEQVAGQEGLQGLRVVLGPAAE